MRILSATMQISLLILMVHIGGGFITFSSVHAQDPGATQLAPPDTAAIFDAALSTTTTTTATTTMASSSSASGGGPNIIASSTTVSPLQGSLDRMGSFLSGLVGKVTPPQGDNSAPAPSNNETNAPTSTMKASDGVATTLAPPMVPPLTGGWTQPPMGMGGADELTLMLETENMTTTSTTTPTPPTPTPPEPVPASAPVNAVSWTMAMAATIVSLLLAMGI